MSKSKEEIMLNYPPSAKVDVWCSSLAPGWKEAIVMERITTETVSGYQVKWRVKMKGEGSYLKEKWVYGTNLIRLRMEDADGITNNKLIDDRLVLQRVDRQ